MSVRRLALLLVCLLPLACRASVYLAGPPPPPPVASYAPAFSLPAVATAIEDRKCGCLLVATSPQNYAFCLDPQANSFRWSSVSVNFHGDVYVTSALEKRPISLQLASMNESQVELVERMFQHFAQNLVFPALSPGVQLSPLGPQRQRRMFLPGPVARPYPMAPPPPPPPANIYQQAKHQQPRLVTNYFNLDQSPHNTSLLGDLYNFDLSGRVLDVYSNSVSLHQGDRSIIYRHPRFFSYSRPNLPVNINRFFVAGDFLLFVYQDGSVLAKPANLLEPVEAALVTEAKKEIDELVHLWPYRRDGDGSGAPNDPDKGADQADRDDEAPDEPDEPEPEAD